MGESLLRGKKMMVKILFSLAAAAVVLGNPVTKSMVKEQQQAAKLAADDDWVPAPVVPHTYRLDDEIDKKKKRKKNKPMKRSVSDGLPDGADDYSAPAPVVPATYRLDVQKEKKNKPKKRSVFQQLPDGQFLKDVPGAAWWSVVEGIPGGKAEISEGLLPIRPLSPAEPY